MRSRVSAHPRFLLSMPAAFHRLLLLALLAAAAAPMAVAVEQTGDILGTVHDEKHQPMPGVTVTLKGSNLQGERAAISDPKGEFFFRALPPGNYSVKVSAPGYQTIEQEQIAVNIGRTTTLPVDLSPGGEETVSVVGRVPVVDTLRTTTQDNYGPEYLGNVQVGSGGRDYLSVISNSAGTGPGDGANPTVRGSTIGGNVYLIDGVDSTDPVTATFGTNFIYDSIQEVQFQTGGFNAEFGRATGGIVNVVTKSGGNEFSGSIDVRYRNENFIEKGDHLDPDQFDISRKIGEGTLGGPVVKDKLWFFLAGSYIRSDQAAAGTPSVFSYNGDYYLGKLTWQITPNHNLAFQITGDPATIDNSDASPLVAPEATSKQTQGSRFISARYQGALSPDLILQSQISYYKAPLDVEPQSGDLSTIGWLNFCTGETTRNALGVQHSDRFRNQADASLTWHKGDWGGDHTFKGGFDIQDLKFKFDQATPGGEYDDVAMDAGGTLIPLDYNVTVSAGELENKGLVVAYFLQDEWRIHPRLTLNLGVRYDTFSYDNDRGRKVFSAGLLQPRAGVSWDATGDAKNVFKVSYGKFGDASLLALPRVVNSRANATDFFINENIASYFFDDPADSCSPGYTPTPVDLNGDGVIEDHAFYATFGGPGGSHFAHNGNLNATNVIEYQTSYERQLNSTSAIGLTLVRRRTYDIIEDRFDQSTGEYVVDNVGQLDRNYYGAELRYRTRWKKLQLAASYTWSKSRGNIEYTQSLGTDFDFHSLSTNRYGYLSDDTRHFFRLNGYYELPLAFQVSYAFSYVSGFPFSVVRAAFPYGSEYVERRGSRRFPDLYQLDLDLRKGFHIGRTDLQAIISVLNVFDTEIVTGVNQAQSQAGEAIAYQTPRRYEVGARFRF